MFLGLILICLGIALAIRRSIMKSKERKRVLSEGEVLKNKYIIEHEKKMLDDKEYEQYLEWCKIKGEVPSEKVGFDKHRMEEYHLYKNLLKNGIGGL
ncbi:hypothetical protein CMT52_17505 [Elizabethkingia anophelis]|nr:hypothetical protein [Elizabethkingia anophelis]